MNEIKPQEIQEIINSVGHTLKTPLIPIKGFTELLKQENIINDKEKRIAYLEIITQNSDKLHAAIINLQSTLETYLTKK